ncbi:MAG: alpha/beta fold hydrolase [Kiloniellaceae bacterium]
MPAEDTATDVDGSAPAEPASLARPDGARIAYHVRSARESGARLPGVVFLGGFMSDMTGGKALALEAGAARRGQAFVRFDYLGHGASSGRFEDGTIGRWADDAVAVLDELTEGPQILVGSSMGGWLMLLAALARPGRVAGLVGIAAAPDFTETLMWRAFPPEVRETLAREGVYYEPSDYGEAPYPITMTLIEEGRAHLLMERPIGIPCPVRLIQGTADPDVPCQLSLDLMERLDSTDVEVTLIKGGGHRLSEPADLARLTRIVDALSDALSS